MEKPNSKLSVLNKDQAASVDRLRSYHLSSIKNAEDHIIYSFLAGKELEGLKASSVNGNSKRSTDGNEYLSFKALREAHFPEISRSAVYRHRNTFTAIMEKVPTVGTFQDRRLLSDGKTEPDAQARKQFLDIVREEFDGKRITAIWRDLGIAKPASPLGRRPGEGGRKRLSLAEKHELFKTQAVEDWQTLYQCHQVYRSKFTCLKDSEIEAQVATLELALKARKAWLKQPKNQRDQAAIESIDALFS